MHTADGSIHPARPFDFSHSLRFMRSFRPCRDEQHVDDHGITKAVMIAGRPIVFTVHPATPTSLHYIVAGEDPIDPCLQLVAQDRIRFFLGTDDDLTEFYEIAARDAAFAPLAERMRGFHQVKFMTPFENTVWAVLGQHIQLHVAQGMKRRFVERFGTKVEKDGREHWAFPAPRTIAELASSAIAGVIRNERKARSIAAVAKAFCTIDESFLRRGDHAEVFEWLQSIEGIGEWSASFVMTRGLGRMERVRAFPPLIDAASQVYGKLLSKKEFAALAQRYGPWQGYWAFYLRSAAAVNARA